MNSNFYKEFEDRFRGSRSIIKDRLQVYLPFIAPFKEIDSAPQAVDLGCGRGEWLEILGENGIVGQGVDLDDGMIAACQEIGLNAHKEEALSFLRNLKDTSQTVITGIHIVEHLQFNDLLMLVKESLRVLKPAGLLILETPNPENLIVGSSSFYIDPTHYRPIPMELLMFVVKNEGFEKVKNLRLQELIQPSEKNSPSLFTVLNGVSPDYAVVAQKQADSKVLEMFSGAFTKSYGYNLSDKVLEYDSALLKKIAENSLRQKINEFETELSTTRQRQVEIETELSMTKQRQVEIETELSTTRQQNSVLNDELAGVFTSRSWRYTKPLRCFLSCFEQVINRKR